MCSFLEELCAALDPLASSHMQQLAQHASSGCQLQASPTSALSGSAEGKGFQRSQLEGWDVDWLLYQVRWRALHAPPPLHHFFNIRHAPTAPLAY